MGQEPFNWQLLVQYFNNPQNTVLEQEVRQWQTASPENEHIFHQLQQIWQLTPELKILDKLDIKAATAQLNAILPQADTFDAPPARRYLWIRIAAISIPAILAAWWFYYNSAKTTYTEKHTLAGNIDSVKLADGSHVYLDKNSKIRYPDKMASTRTVFMEQGTAFFEIAPQAGKPFIVKLQHSSITVLGTAFNIQLKDNSIGVTVKSGKIKFAAEKNNEQETILSAGDGLEFSPATGAIQLFNAVNNNEDAWITHELIFVDAPLSEVCKKMESFYQVKISLQGKIPVKKLNATFKDNKLEEVLEVLQATYPIAVAQRNKTITITGR
jgi:transmembrane sensor